MLDLIAIFLLFLHPFTSLCCRQSPMMPMIPPMGGGFGMGGFPTMGGFGLGFPSSNMFGTGSAWAASGGLIGNALAFLLG
ncbi:unnamed protein product [Cylicocyclus nassatus]|uniref:Uncharacterized protein n=1 Tax=Cylicocyclus nassatus TaxID=53992 RepID=A0AA36DS96_CYLNA|nr:unnamed protein product [Cylicocyclus nassatus]